MSEKDQSYDVTTTHEVTETNRVEKASSREDAQRQDYQKQSGRKGKERVTTKKVEEKK